MGLFDGLMGNVSEVNVTKVKEDLQEILAPSETIVEAYKLIRDLLIFTSKRLILIDKQGVTGKKTEFHSYPYKSIVHFSVESAGHFDLEAELNLWISGSDTPVKINFNRSANINVVQKILAEKVLG